MDKSLLEEVKKAAASLPGQPNVSTPSSDELRVRAHQFGMRTAFGNYNFVSTVKNRSGALTVHLGSDRVTTKGSTQKKRDIRRGAAETVRLVHNYLQKAPLVRVSCTMGDNDEFAPVCNMYISVYRREMVRLAHKINSTFFPVRNAGGPELNVVFIPEWQEKDRQILVFPEIGVTYVLGTDYYGEANNAFLRMAMWKAKQQGMLGLHAGTKLIRARGTDGRIRKLGVMVFGIAGTGKTTHICHDHGLDLPGEGIEIQQDEVVFWSPNGSALGAQRGLYVKTEGLNPESNPLLYNAATSENAILDNVMVDYEGNVYFNDRTLTANGRAIIQRSDLDSFAGPTIDLPPIEELDGLLMLFMSRNFTVLPIASRLTPEQAVVAFMLSQSIDITGAEAKEAMAASREGAANPYLVGDPADDANRFYELLKSNESKIECYMLNTGGAGELVDYGLDGAKRVQRKVTRVQISEMASVIRSIARGTVRWREDSNWMLETPEYVEGLDLSKFDPAVHYDQEKIDALIAAMRMERAKYAAQFAGLDPAIVRAVEF